MHGIAGSPHDTCDGVMDDGLDDQLRAIAGAPGVGDDDGMVDRVAAFVLGTPPPMRTIDRFRVERALGHGGMGRVYEAWDPRLQRRVALKLLRTDLGTFARRREVLEAEARALAKLTDRHVVQVYEIGEHDGGLCVVMELVDGQSLDRWQATPRTLPELLEVYVQAARGLAAAHRVGLVHRDFKPANVLVRADGEVRVADFGLARAVDPDHDDVVVPEPGDDARRSDAPTQSRSGTRAYMAPEQLAFGTTDARSDQFSFCVALYEAVCGVRPFGEAELREASTQPAHAIAPTRGTRRVPRWLLRILARGSSARPYDRYPSMDALVQALVATPRRRRVVAATAIAGVVLAGAWWWQRPTPSCDPSAAIETVWNPAMIERLRGAGTDAPSFAVASVAALERELGAWTQRWREDYAAACDATWVRGTRTGAQLERTVACLERGRVALGKAVELVEGATPETLAQASAAASALPEPAHCMALDGLAQGEPLSERELALVRTGDTSQLLLALGRPLDALALLDGDPPDGSERGRVAATVWLARGVDLAALSRSQPAEHALLEAAGLALADDDLRTAVAAWRELLVLYARELLDGPRAAMAEQLLQRLQTRVELDAIERAESIGARALAADLRQDFTGALALSREALALLEGSGRADPLRLARHRRQLATALQRAGELDAAYAMHATNRSEVELALGPAHPELGRIELAMGALQLDRERLDEARVHFEAALAIVRAALGVDSVRTAAPLGALAHLALLRDENALAVELATQAWALEQTLPVGHEERGTALRVLAVAHERIGEHARALADHEVLLRELGERASAEELDIHRINVGFLLCRLSRCAEAREPYERVLRAHVPGEPMYHYAHSGLAQVELAEDRPRQALARARRELDDPDMRALGDAGLVAELSWTLARALAQTGARAGEFLPYARAAEAYYAVRPADLVPATAIAEFIAQHGDRRGSFVLR